MLSVANRIDSALQVGFSISKIGLVVIKLFGFLLTPLSIPGLEQVTQPRNELICTAHTQRLNYLLLLLFIIIFQIYHHQKLHTTVIQMSHSFLM